MMHIFDLFEKKIVKIISTALFGSLFILSLISTIIGWNASLPFNIAFCFSLVFYEKFPDMLPGFQFLEIDYKGASFEYALIPNQLALQTTVVLGLFLLLMLFNIYFKSVDNHYILRTGLLMGNGLCLLFMNIHYYNHVKLAPFGITLASLFLIFASLYALLSILSVSRSLNRPWFYIVHLGITHSIWIICYLIPACIIRFSYNNNLLYSMLLSLGMQHLSFGVGIVNMVSPKIFATSAIVFSLLYSLLFLMSLFIVSLGFQKKKATPQSSDNQ